MSNPKDSESVSRTLLSTIESQIAFAQLFIAVARRAYLRGELRLADHARRTATRASQLIAELLPHENDLPRDLIAELSVLRQALHHLEKDLETDLAGD